MSATPYFAAALLAHARPAVEAHKRRRAFCAPEVMEFPDDTFMDWADALIYTAEPVITDLIQYGTPEDMQAVLTFFTDTTSTWPAHRRAFFSCLHTYAIRMETEGRGEASQAFADFMRERYMPPYFYIVERERAPHMFPATAAVPPRTPSPPTPSSAPSGRLVTIQEASHEVHDDDENEEN